MNLALAIVAASISTFSLTMNWITYRAAKRKLLAAKSLEDNARAIYASAVDLLNASRKKP